MPRAMRIDYDVSSSDYKRKWVCPKHTIYARENFIKWWLKRATPDYPVPDTAEEAGRLANAGILSEPVSITVKWVAGEQFERITKCRPGPIPEPREPGDDVGEFNDED